ncbi:hypothetical protein [Pedobacter sp.]|uniref:hypothetical protein n=1 Tax=Pedobacter sp. TaxID=1411316 RepID=UPI0031E4823E
MRYILLLLLFVKITNSYGQSYYEVDYTSGEVGGVRLTVGNDSFKLKGFFDGVIKAKGDTNIYCFVKNRDNSYAATKIKISEYVGSELFKEQNLFWKIDTIFVNKDTVINDMLCKRIMINYVSSFEDDQKNIISHDTIFTNLYVAKSLTTVTPFTFTSDKITGIILKYVKCHPEYDASNENEKAIRFYRRTEIFSTVTKVYNIKDEFFKLPKDCRYVKSYDELMAIE